MLTPKQIRERVKTIIQLPALPSLTMEIAEMLENPRTSAAKLGVVISSDQSLTAKVLKIANSPFYGFPRKISTIEFAIIILGFEAIKEIVMSVALVNSLQKKTNKYFDEQKFWDHSISSAVIARRIARDMKYRVTGEAFVAGLLHDMGLSIMHRYFFNEFKKLKEIAASENIVFLKLEERLLGVTHAEIGGWLAQRWNLPDHLVEAITHHHQPGLAKHNPELAALIHCADMFDTMLNENKSEYDSRLEISSEALNCLNIKGQDEQIEFITKYRTILKSDLDNLNQGKNYLENKQW